MAYVCLDPGNGLWYHGVRRSDGASITLPAHRDGVDYVARHEPTGNRVRVEYRVNDQKLTRSTPTKVELDEPVVRSG